MNATYQRLAAPVLVLLLATTASPQAPGNNSIMRAAWNPVVGAGAAYVIEHKEMGKVEMEIAVVGAETVAGKAGYWVEQIMKDPKYGEGRTKILYVGDRNTLQIKKMFTQGPGGPLTEAPTDIFEGGTEEQEEYELLGTENVTTPAGTFPCRHYRTKQEKTASEDAETAGQAKDVEDFWLSEKVTPFGLVKMVSKNSTQILARLITNAKPRTTETPQKPDSKETKRPRPQH